VAGNRYLSGTATSSITSARSCLWHSTRVCAGANCSAHMGSVNFSAKLLTVTAATAKSGHTRRVPLNVEALATLTAWHERQGKPAADTLVFPGHDGERMTRIDTAWGTLMTTAALKNFRLHDCRHHFASKLVQAGVDLYTVKELLGHSEVAMTEKYSHLAPDNLRLAVEKVAG